MSCQICNDAFDDSWSRFSVVRRGAAFLLRVGWCQKLLRRSKNGKVTLIFLKKGNISSNSELILSSAQS